MTWKHIYFDGTRYDLSHLQDFEFNATRPATDKEEGWSIPVVVRFSWHCYTKKPEQNETSHTLKQGREERCFSLDRFEESLVLPDIITSLMERKIFQTGKGNYITIEAIDKCGVQVNYEIYFSLKKQGKGNPLKLFVQSAYLREGAGVRQKQKRQAIRFRVLVYNTHHNKGIGYKK